MNRAAVLFAGLALAACSGAPAPAPSPKATPPAPLVKGGWAGVFGGAANTVELLNNIGFRLTPYTQTGPDSHKATAMVTPMSDPSTKPVNMANLTLNGDAKTLGDLRFTLDLVNLDSSAFAKQQFTRWITTGLSQLGVPGGDAITPAIVAENDKSGTLPGAAWRTTREKIDGGRRLIVTFTRPEAMSGTSEPRKQ